MAEYKAKPLFEYHPAFRFGGGDKSLQFVEQVCIRVGAEGLPPPNPLLGTVIVNTTYPLHQSAFPDLAFLSFFFVIVFYFNLLRQSGSCTSICFRIVSHFFCCC